MSKQMPQQVAGISTDQLKSYIERIEDLEESKREVAEHIKDVFYEAKSAGYDPKIMRIIIRLRKMDKDDVDEQETMLSLYKQALGMEIAA